MWLLEIVLCPFLSMTSSLSVLLLHLELFLSLCFAPQTYQIDPDQELVALSCCNFFGSFFQCFPCATSLSRTSVISSTGARTQLHNISSVLVLVLTLSVITPLLFYLPNAVLAAVVLFGVYGMMDFKELIHLCRIGQSKAFASLDSRVRK